jgi:MraZ protein
VGESGARRRSAGVLPLIGELEHMFLGRFYHTLDDKGRLTIPARFRDLLLPDGAYVMQGFDKNLLVLPTAAFNVLSQEVNQKSMTDPTSRLLRRLVFSTANRLEFDRAGRILIPQFLRQSAGLDTDVVVVGAGRYFEIWSPDAWEAQDEQLQDAQANAQRFSAFDLTSG